MSSPGAASAAKPDRKAVHPVDVPGLMLTRAGDLYADEERRRREKQVEKAILRAQLP